MKKLMTLLLAAVPFMGMMAQEVEITTNQAKSYYKDATAKKRVSVHDPSVVYDSSTKRHYIFGTMRGTAYTTDFQNWTGVDLSWTKSGFDNVFETPATTKVTKDGAEVDFPAFNAYEWSSCIATHGTNQWGTIEGNMWAPDVIWNPTMNKWCQYVSINGLRWNSSIVLLTSDNITGPYEYQGPVVITGFNVDNNANVNYKKTDLEVVLGTQSSLPSRYNTSWGNRWPHAIDPCVFYDEEGKLWMVYGSWSGGIWMLELDETTGLRDYSVTYPSTNGSSNGVTSDPYFGTKVAGGYYVSGEGPYIEHIGDYYYLFVSYGGYAPDGGYEMRVFRSEKPNGPYKDAGNRSAIFTGYVMNYGTGSSDMRGEKIMGAYNEWGFMTGTAGECAQGHNSIIAANDGRTYLIYHTKFNDGHPENGFHAVRVHQVFQNKQGWLVAAPFEYNGETITSADIATTQQVATDDIPGIYQILIHKYRMDYKNMEEVTPLSIELTADGQVTGAYSGTWSNEEGTCYLTIKLGTVTYNGVIFEEQIDGKTIKTISFSAMATSGVNVWGYKYRPDYSLAWQLNNAPITSPAYIYNQNYDLYNQNLVDNVKLKWTSDNPLVISDYGQYYPLGLTANATVKLTARLTAGNYFWERTSSVLAKSEENSKPTATTNWDGEMVAHYKFDTAELPNALNTNEKAELKQNGTTALPVLEQDADSLRNGKVVRLNFGAANYESYVVIPNPLKGVDLTTTGATFSFYVKRYDDNLWDALFGVQSGTARFFVTPNLYVGYNDGVTPDEGSGVYNNWIDLNQPNTLITNAIGLDRWHMVTISVSPSQYTGFSIFIDGTKLASTKEKYNGKLNGTTFTAKQGFDYKLILNMLSTADEICLGKGSFWGSPNVAFDDFIVHSRCLTTANEAAALRQMINRSDINQTTTGISEMPVLSEEQNDQNDSEAIYDLSGRKVTTLKPGLYIKNGKKFVVR